MIAEVGSEIRAVTVYSRGARVTRIASLPTDGERPSHVRIAGLPLAADDDSIHVSVRATADRPGPSATDVRIALDVCAPTVDMEPADDAELADARRAELTVSEKLAQVQRELSRLDRLAILPRPAPEDGDGAAAQPFESRLALIEHRAARSELLLAEQRTLKAELQVAHRRRLELEDREARRTTARAPREHELRKTVVVQLDHDSGDGAAELVVEYIVPGARWAPSYAVEFDPDAQTAQVTMRASLIQNSGEDWTHVELALSTAEPQWFTRLPELASLRIGPRKPASPPIGWRPPMGLDASLFEAYDVAFGTAVAPEAEEPLQPPAQEPAPKPYLDDVTAEHKVEFDRLLAEEDFSTAIVEVMPRQARGRQRERAARPTEPMPAGPAGLDASAILPPVPPPVASGTVPPNAAPPPGLTANRVAGQTHHASEVADTEDGVLVASDELLDYGALYMPSPQEPGRGVLRRLPLTERYLGLLRERDVRLDFDALRAVTDATMCARYLEYSDPPPRCTFAWSERFDYVYRASAPATVASDGCFHSVPVCQSRGKATVRHVCVPRAAKEVYRVATIENPFDAPILTGPADVYLGGDFVVTSEMPVTARGASLDLGLGVEQSVKVARNTRYGEGSSGLLGGSRALRHEIHVEVENLLDRSVELEVRERIPSIAGGEEGVEVEVGKVSPAWAPWEPLPDRPGDEPLRGGHRWNLTIPPRESREMRVHYQIKIAAKNELVGGNRREA